MVRKPLLATILAIIMMSVPCASISAPAFAQSASRTVDLDELFLALKNAPSEYDAAAVSSLIWQIWMTPDDPALAILLQEVRSARVNMNIARTMELLDQIIALYPDYAEGWNRRATLHYELGNYQESLDDIDETLQREPRHFGALSGQALVYLALDDKDKARQSIKQALEYHPFVAEHPPFSNLVVPTVNI